jgi:hypothetical protein
MLSKPDAKVVYTPEGKFAGKSASPYAFSRFRPCPCPCLRRHLRRKSLRRHLRRKFLDSTLLACANFY